MAKAFKKTLKKNSREPKNTEDDKLWGFLAVFLSIIGFFLVILLKKKSEYVTFYAKQSLVLFIAFVVSSVVGMVPVIGLIASPILWLAVFVLWIFGWAYALSGKMKPVPLIGPYAKKIEF